MKQNTYSFPISEEMWLDRLALRYGGDFMRKVKSRTETPPTEAEWALYREAVELLEKLEANPYFHVGGYDYELEVREPAPHVHIEYAETEAEYAARVRTLNPDDYETVWERMANKYFVVESTPPAPTFAMPEYPPRHPATLKGRRAEESSHM